MSTTTENRLKVALIGTSQLSFPGDKPGRFKNSASALSGYLKNQNVDLYIYDKTVITKEDAIHSLKVIEAEKPDFLLIQCTTYSAGFLAHVYVESGYPMGWWAIPEANPGGVMEYNSFCSINMFQAIARNYYNEDNIKIKWFFGEVSDSLFII